MRFSRTFWPPPGCWNTGYPLFQFAPNVSTALRFACSPRQTGRCRILTDFVQATFRLTCPRIIHFATGQPRRQQLRRNKRRLHRLLLTTLHAAQCPEIRFLTNLLRPAEQKRGQILNLSPQRTFLYVPPKLFPYPTSRAAAYPFIHVRIRWP